MTPLIKSIPSKDLTVLGRMYRVYEPVKVNSKELWFCSGGTKTKYTIRPLTQVLKDKDPSIYFHKLDQLVEDLNRKVEKEYIGDSFHFAREDTGHCISTYKTGKVVLNFSFQSLLTMKAVRVRSYLGVASELTESFKEKVGWLAGQYRLIENRKYNNFLRQKRNIFRITVDREIAERDAKAKGIKPGYLPKVV